jgi:hypothetical protein
LSGAVRPHSAHRIFGDDAYRSDVGGYYDRCGLGYRDLDL